MSPFDDASLAAAGRVRTNLSFIHLMSAARFSKTVQRLEEEHAGHPFGPFFEEIIAHASASVLLAVAGLEAFVNEMFIDHSKYLSRVNSDLVAHLWNRYESGGTPLERLDLALLLLNRPPLNQTRPPAQNVVCLIPLRNALTHFKPEWDPNTHAKLSQQLRGRFNLTLFLTEPELIFPRRWASHGCTVGPSIQSSNCLDWPNNIFTARREYRSSPDGWRDRVPLQVR
jgi:hypothetical protein